jgi:hypothetical protein
MSLPTENQLLMRVPAIFRKYLNLPESREWLEEFAAVQFAKRLAVEQAGTGTQHSGGVVAATPIGQPPLCASAPVGKIANRKSQIVN